MDINIHAAWIGMLLGGIAGAVPGLFFYKEDWLGGYNSWRRRMIRLGHISFFGIGFINLLFALTARSLGIEDGLILSSRLFIVAAVMMPLICYTSAFKPVCRNLFFIPAVSLIIAVAMFLWRIFN